MKKSKHSYGSSRRSVKPISDAPIDDSLKKLDSIDEDDQGFGGWLRSEDGLENMKLFVIANSIVLLTTITYPHIQYVIGMISEALYGADGVVVWYSLNMWKMIADYFNEEFKKIVFNQTDEEEYYEES